VPVKGPKGKGVLILFADKPSQEEDEELSLSRAELEIDSTETLLPEQFRGKRLVVFARERHGDVGKYCPKRLSH